MILETLTVLFESDTNSLTKGLNEVSTQSNSVVKGLSNVGGAVVTGGLALAGAGIAALGVETVKGIDAASDLNETYNKVGVIFGDVGNQIIAASEDAATAFGMTRQEMLDGASTFATFGKAAGLTGQDLADFSLNLSGLAPDLASFYNADPSEVVNALGAALRGETEPMRKFGVLLDDASLRSEAFAMGLIDSTKNALTPQQKVLAANNLIMKQTMDAQGDFAKTSDGLANSQRIVKAEVENLTASWGQAFLPVVQQGVNFLAQLLPQIEPYVVNFANVIASFIPVAITAFQNLVSFLQNNQGIIVAILAALGVAVGAFVYTTIIPAAVAAITAMAPIIAVMLAVAAVAYLLYQAWTTNFLGVRDITNDVITFVKTFIQNALANIKAFWDAHGQQIMSTVTAMWSVVQTIFNAAMNVIRPLVEAFLALLHGDFRTFGEKLREAWNAAWENLKNIVNLAKTWFSTKIPELINNVISFFTNTDWGQVGKNIIDGIANGITSAVGWLKEAAQKAAQAALDAAKGFLGIESPSKAFKEVGKYMMQGWGIGINQFASVPVDATYKVSQNTLSGISNSTKSNTDYSDIVKAIRDNRLDETQLALAIISEIQK